MDTQSFEFQENFSFSLVEGLPRKPSAQPSRFWKALSYTFLPILAGGTGSLEDEGQALFVAAQGQPGIPEGRTLPQEVTNYQVFIKTDVIQTINRPSYSASNGRSYFELLYRYLRYATAGAETPDIRNARKALFDAEAKKEAAWKAALHAFRPTAATSFVDALSHDKAYLDAWNVEQQRFNEYKSLQTPEMEDMLKQLDITKSANDRLLYKINNTMPCIGLSEDQTVPLEPLQVDTKDVFYRPRHSLSDYERQYAAWLGQSKMLAGPYHVHLAEVDTLTWAGLGHPDLDQAKPLDVSSIAMDLYKIIDVQLWFMGGPAAAVDVERGLWNYQGFRDLGKLSEDAPSYLREPFCKTTKLLLAWGLRMEIMFPSFVSEMDRRSFIASLRFPFRQDEHNKDMYFSQSGADTYPVLLAALADIV
ncbi:hypothetical protein BKA58DRAFT_376586 [Alternaria rosae]|uniref:uncharacterized protein n=1 Tax=Alternaria rosae TaxID=1187941 RepID=UPI001E8E0441|nr:uncharacterized protein BKA58DRAFT_376586 [Alternaria rosae]KAH6878140.1 hypothetical protein BKA58DRAFT_376586 [Alternaria rosae]